jgi:hypothetical protein
MKVEENDKTDPENCGDENNDVFPQLKSPWKKALSMGRQFITGRFLSPPETTFGWAPNIVTERALIGYLEWLHIRQDYETKRLRVWALGVIAFMLYRLASLISL